LIEVIQLKKNAEEFLQKQQQNWQESGQNLLYSSAVWKIQLFKEGKCLKIPSLAGKLGRNWRKCLKIINELSYANVNFSQFSYYDVEAS
jgi:hypothetical protein